MERASVRFAGRCGGQTSTRPRHCAAFSKRRAMNRRPGRSGSQIARLRTPCAGRFSVRAWSARVCGL
eukprot:5038238-Lingulodinium_polyedra.AAC.1